MKSTRLLAFGLLASLVLTGQACSISFRTNKNLDGGIFRSTDGGITWQQTVLAGLTKKNKPIKIDNVNVQWLEFDPQNPRIMYLGTLGAGIYRTEDGGDNWSKTGLGLGTYPAFTIDPSSSSIIYAAAGGTIQKSSDSAASWAPIYIESKPDRAVTDIAVQPGNISRVLAATSTGELLLSQDFGNTWQLFSSIGVADGVTKMFFAPGSSTILYALTTASGLFRSTDLGQTWESLAASLATFPGAGSISFIATLPNRPNDLYIATGYGLLKTSDGGKTWEPIQTLVPFASQPIQFVAVNPNNLRVLYVIVGNRLRKSEDGGINWDAKITLPTARLVSTLALNPESPETLYIGTIKPKK